MQRKQSMEWAKEQVFSCDLSLAVARTVCCRRCDSEQAWRREAVSAHQPDGSGFLWFIISLLIQWHLEKARRFPGICKTGGCIPWFAEMILQSEFKLKGQLLLL